MLAISRYFGHISKRSPWSDVRTLGGKVNRSGRSNGKENIEVHQFTTAATVIWLLLQDEEILGCGGDVTAGFCRMRRI
jgi:hypothetical protein